jgi:hypothetical protein
VDPTLDPRVYNRRALFPRGGTGDGIVVCIGPQRGAAQLFRVEEVDARQPGLVVVHRTDTTAYYGPLYCVQVDRRVAQNVAWSKSS